MFLFVATSLHRREIATMLVREWSNLRIVLGTFIDFIWDYRFIRSSTKLNASRSTIAEANLDDTRSIFVRSRERSTTYRVKRSSDVAFFPCGAVCMD